MDVGKAMVYAVLYQLQFLQIQEESANAGFAPAEKACPGVEALNGVAARAGYRPAIERHAAFAVVDVGDKDAVGFRLAGGREVVKRMRSERASVQGSGSGYIRIPGQPSATFAGRSCFLFAVSLFYQAGEVNIKIVFI